MDPAFALLREGFTLVTSSSVFTRPRPVARCEPRRSELREEVPERRPRIRRRLVTRIVITPGDRVSAVTTLVTHAGARQVVRTEPSAPVRVRGHRLRGASV